MMNLVLMGAPGAGKGTQSEKISAKWNIPAISTGEILRAAMKEGTPLGLQAKEYVDNGRLVPNEVMIGIIKDRLKNDDCKNGFILDGFPRSIPQAIALDELGVRIDAALSIDVDDVVIVERMGGRRICSGCGLSYHIIYNAPSTEGICDKCSSSLYIRPDDAAETVKVRLATYHKDTEPIKAYYAKKGLLIEVEGQRKVEDTTNRVFSALAKFDV
jgi:adenylate kinase